MKKRIYIINILLQLFEKFIKMIVALVVFALVARILGPTEYGKLSFVRSFVGLFSFLSALGMESILVRNIVQSDSISRKKVLGSAVFLRLIGSLLIFIFILTILKLKIIEYNENIILFSIIYLFQSVWIIEYYYQAKVESYKIVIIQIISIVVFSILNMYGVKKGYSYSVFLKFEIVYIGIISLFYVLLLKYDHESIFKWSIDKKTAIQLLVDCAPLILSSAFISIYMKVDEIMLTMMLNSYETGIYSAAARITKSLFFIPIIISNTIFPYIINRSRQKNNVINDIILQNELILLISVIILILLSIFSKTIILLIYGPEFKESINVFILHVWSFLFVGLSVGTNKVLILNNLQKIILFRSILGAFINILLNYFFIKNYFSFGAAGASMITQIFVTMFALFFFKESRQYAKFNWIPFKFTQIRLRIKP